MNNSITGFYNNLGGDYYDNWKKLTNGMRIIRRFEVDFIESGLRAFKVGVNRNLMILDVGSGPGRIAEIILKDKQFKYQGIDISPEMLKALRKKFRKKSNFVGAKVGDISVSLPYKPNSFDIITSVRVLKYNRNWPEIIKDIYRVLKRGGLFLFSIPNKHSLNFFSKGDLPIYKTTIRQIISVLKKAGFKNIKIGKSSKLSDVFYSKTNNKHLLGLYSWIEKILNLIFKEKFSRLLYVSCNKK